MDLELFSKMSAFQFVSKYFSRIFLASSGWLIFNIVFFGLLILIDQPTKVIGLNKGMFISQKIFGINLYLCTIILYFILVAFLIVFTFHFYKCRRQLLAKRRRGMPGFSCRLSNTLPCGANSRVLCYCADSRCNGKKNNSIFWIYCNGCLVFFLLWFI
jgi:hypothetical protein